MHLIIHKQKRSNAHVGLQHAEKSLQAPQQRLECHKHWVHSDECHPGQSWREFSLTQRNVRIPT